MARNRYNEEIINVNVSGKKYTVRRSDMLADSRSRLAEWFKPGQTKSIATDKGGNYYLDRDPKSFRHILAFLRLKKEKFVPVLALPSQPDELAKLVGECEALHLNELKQMAVEMLQMYQRTEEQHYANSFVQATLKDLNSWQFDKELDSMHIVNNKKIDGVRNKESEKSEAFYLSSYEDWDNI